MSYTTYVLPFQSMVQNYQETINEIFVLIAGYHLFCFTEWVYDLNMRFTVGWSLLGFVGLNLAINIGIMLVIVFKSSIQRIKVLYFTREKKRILQEN